MLYTVKSEKSLDQVCTDLEKAVSAHQFGLVAKHDLRQTMEKKGVSFDRECRVYEVCNPHQAKKVLEVEMQISTALPCRISVYEADGKVVLATVKPEKMLALYDVPGLGPIATEVEKSMIAIMTDAAG